MTGGEIRSARLAAWATAFLDGRVSLDEATLRIVGGDLGHDVIGLPGCEGPTSLTLTLGWLRREGVRGLRLALPIPGDPAGLPGPAELNVDAVDAGEAVITDGAMAFGFVPRIAGEHVVWRAHLADARPPASASLAEAERTLTETLATCTEALTALDVAALTPEAAEALAQFRDEDRRAAGSLPPGHPARAARVLALADRLTAIAGIAALDDGTAHSRTLLDRRHDLLEEVCRAARHARMAAYNAVLEPASSDTTATPAGARRKTRDAVRGVRE